MRAPWELVIDVDRDAALPPFLVAIFRVTGCAEWIQEFNPSGNLLISASVLFPLTDAGLRSGVATIVGLDYAF